MKTFTVLLFNLLAIHSMAQFVTTLVDDPSTKFTDALIFDASGNLYCADYSGSSVFKRTPDGTITTFASGMDTPNGMAFDSNGHMFICDNQGDAIYKIDANGVFLDTFPTSKPSGIVKDVASDTMIFTVYSNQHELRKLAPDGTILPFHAGGELNGPVGLAYVGNNLYVGNFNNRKVFRVESDTLVYIATVPGPGNGYLGFIAAAGNKLYGTSWHASKIYEIVTTETDSIIYLAGNNPGSLDGAIDTATFSQPNGIIANTAGDTIYVSQYSTGKLRMITQLSLGQSELNPLADIRYYPNPTTDYVTIELSHLSKPTLEIYSIDGVLIRKEMNPDQSVIDLKLPDESGVYLVKVTEDKFHRIFRILKENK